MNYTELIENILKKEKKIINIENKILENFAEEKEPSEQGLSLHGNLNMQGNVSAQNFYLLDGSKISSMAKVPDNVELDGDNITINKDKPDSKVNLGGSLGVKSKLGVGTNDPDSALHVIGDKNEKTTEEGIHLGKVSNNQSLEFSSAGDFASVDFKKAGEENRRGEIKYDINNNNLSFSINSNETMRINSDGNIGIGTNDPKSRLQVVGERDIKTTDAGIHFGKIDEDYSMEFVGDSNTFIDFKKSGQEDRKGRISYNLADNNMFFEVNNENYLMIKNDGNIGVGTEDPKSMLHVSGNIRTDNKLCINQTCIDENKLKDLIA